MGALANRDFVKMNGLGNEIVIVDLRRAPQSIAAAEARAAAQQEPYDQLMALYPRAAAAATLRSASTTMTARKPAPAATACAALPLWSVRKPAVPRLKFETAGGNHCPASAPTTACSRSTWDGRACAGTRFRWRDEFADTRAIELEIGPRGAPVLHSPSAVSMGNPHAIFWVDDPAAFDLATIGPLLEHHPMFPERANITLAATPSRDHIVIRTWERGAGLTQACGTAACAAAVAAARLDRTGRKVTVTLPGGDLAIEWRESDDHVLMTGPVEYEHKGRFDAALSAGAWSGV